MQGSRLSDGFGWKLKISRIPCDHSPTSGNHSFTFDRSCWSVIDPTPCPGQLFPSGVLCAGSVGLKRWLPNHTLNPEAKLLPSPLSYLGRKRKVFWVLSACVRTVETIGDESTRLHGFSNIYILLHPARYGIPVMPRVRYQARRYTQPTIMYTRRH